MRTESTMGWVCSDGAVHEANLWEDFYAMQLCGEKIKLRIRSFV